MIVPGKSSVGLSQPFVEHSIVLCFACSLLKTFSYHGTLDFWCLISFLMSCNLDYQTAGKFVVTLS